MMCVVSVVMMCVVSVVIKCIQIKATVGKHFTQIRLSKILKLDNAKCS